MRVPDRGSIRTTKYTILTFLPKNLFEQFHRVANVYFVIIVILNWIPQISAFGKEVAMIPIVFVLSVTAIKDAFEDRFAHHLYLRTILYYTPCLHPYLDPAFYRVLVSALFPRHALHRLTRRRRARSDSQVNSSKCRVLK